MSTTTTARHFFVSCRMWWHSLLIAVGVRGLGIQEEPVTAPVVLDVMVINAFGLS